MKNNFTLLVLAFALLSFNFSTKEMAKESMINWRTMSYELGQIKLNQPSEVVFSFQNTGEAPIQILAAKASCGCTVASFTEGMIKAGDFGEVMAIYNAKKLGVFSKTITVTVSDTNEPMLLTLKGEVIK